MKPFLRFFDAASEELHACTFVIIVSRFGEKYVWVRHRDRQTWELPAGHVEPGESPEEAARRELYEETGALEYNLTQQVAYEGIYNNNPVFGMIYLAEIVEFGPMPEFEIAEIDFIDGIPDQLTYPEIQPEFVRHILGTRME